MKGEIIVVP